MVSVRSTKAHDEGIPVSKTDFHGCARPPKTNPEAAILCSQVLGHDAVIVELKTQISALRQEVSVQHGPGQPAWACKEGQSVALRALRVHA